MSTETKVVIVCDVCRTRYGGRRGWFTSAHAAALMAFERGWRIWGLSPTPMTDLQRGTYDICPRCAKKAMEKKP